MKTRRKDRVWVAADEAGDVAGEVNAALDVVSDLLSQLNRGHVPQAQVVATHTAFDSVYMPITSRPLSRPKPLPLCPPKGIAGSNMS